MTDAGVEAPEPRRTATGFRHQFVDTLAWVITGAWATSFILDALISHYDPPVTVHLLMTTLAGAAFTGNLIRKEPTDAP